MTMTDDDCKAFVEFLIKPTVTKKDSKDLKKHKLKKHQLKQEKYFFTYFKEQLMQDNQLKELIIKFCDKYYNDCDFVDITVIDENVINIYDNYWCPNDMKLALDNDIPEQILFDYYNYGVENYKNDAKNYENVLDYFNYFKNI